MARILRLLWLWRRPVATAPIQPLAWEPPYATGAAQKIAKRQKKELWKHTTVSFISVCKIYKCVSPRGTRIWQRNHSEPISGIHNDYILCLHVFWIFFFFVCVCLFAISWGTPVAYGGSQARGLIGAVATGLRQSHTMPDLSHVCDLYHSTRQRQILNPRSKASDQTHNLMVPSRIR